MGKIQGKILLAIAVVAFSASIVSTYLAVRANENLEYMGKMANEIHSIPYGVVVMLNRNVSNYSIIAFVSLTIGGLTVIYYFHARHSLKV